LPLASLTQMPLPAELLLLDTATLKLELMS
jgi:hypothetical protein